MRKTVLFLAILVLTLTPATILQQLTEVRAQGTTFTMDWGASPMATINPTQFTVFDGGSYVMLHAMYDTLVKSDTSGNPVPDLATSWTYKNPTTIDFNLVHNATWHDAQPFTSADVVFTLNLYMAHTEFPMVHNYAGTIASVQAIDNYTVEIQTKQPDATFLDYHLLGLYIIPEHIWSSIANYTSYTNSNPVGTGPFRFVKWGGPNTYIQLAANPDYFYGRPHIDSLVIQYTTSYSAQSLAIESGQVDYAGPLFPPSIVPTLTSTPGVEVVTRPDDRYFYFCFNEYASGTGNPVLR